MISRYFREREFEHRPIAGAWLNPDAPFIERDYFFTDGESDSGSRIFAARMKTGEDLEYAIMIAGRDADAVIAN